MPHSAHTALPLTSGLFAPPPHNVGMSVREEVDAGVEEIVTEFVEEEKPEKKLRRVSISQ